MVRGIYKQILGIYLNYAAKKYEFPKMFQIHRQVDVHLEFYRSFANN